MDYPRFSIFSAHSTNAIYPQSRLYEKKIEEKRLKQKRVCVQLYFCLE